jgi:hypothetical protein
MQTHVYSCCSQNNPGKITEPIIKAAGTDISNWWVQSSQQLPPNNKEVWSTAQFLCCLSFPHRFDPKTRDIRTVICPVTNLERFYTPMVCTSRHAASSCWLL